VRQRTTTAWAGTDHVFTSRLRVLVESADPTLALSDFARYTTAGFDVALCRGPQERPEECPLVRGEACALAAGADVILFGLGPPGDGVLDAARRHHRATPMVLQGGPRAPAPDADLPEGCEVLLASASVHGQISALRRAALAGRRRRTRHAAR
jgi:hypothetical protein